MQAELKQSEGSLEFFVERNGAEPTALVKKRRNAEQVGHWTLRENALNSTLYFEFEGPG